MHRRRVPDKAYIPESSQVMSHNGDIALSFSLDRRAVGAAASFRGSSRQLMRARIGARYSSAPVSGRLSLYDTQKIVLSEHVCSRVSRDDIERYLQWHLC